MPFGLRNAAQSFQRFMDSLFRDLTFVFVYIDDILVASKDEAEHRRHLETIFQQLADNGITINAAKCLFAVNSLDFLGHHISSTGIRPMAAKVADILEFPQPESQRQLRKFLGMVNVYHRFIPNCAHTLAPLHDLANASRTRNAPLAWCDVSLSAFNDIKSSLADATLVVHPDTNAPTSVAVDASSLALGAVLPQYQNGQWSPLAFFSRKLSAAERNYSTFGRELLAIYSAVKHFRYFLEGRVFTVYTDHKPLCYSLSSSTSRHSPREIRHLAFISEFTTDIRHISGANNPVADALSRVEALSLPTQDLDLVKLAADQHADTELQQLRQSTASSLQWSEVSLPGAPRPLLCDLSTGTPRPYLLRCINLWLPYSGAYFAKVSGIPETPPKKNKKNNREAARAAAGSRQDTKSNVEDLRELLSTPKKFSLRSHLSPLPDSASGHTHTHTHTHTHSLSFSLSLSLSPSLSLSLPLSLSLSLSVFLS